MKLRWFTVPALFALGWVTQTLFMEKLWVDAVIMVLVAGYVIALQVKEESK